MIISIDVLIDIRLRNVKHNLENVTFLFDYFSLLLYVFFQLLNNFVIIDVIREQREKKPKYLLNGKFII